MQGGSHAAHAHLLPELPSGILPADVNVGTDVAYCRSCAKPWRLSALVNADGPLLPSLPASGATGAALDEALAQPPPGVSFQETARGFDLRATTRSPIAFFLVPFTLVWSGGSMGGIYGTQL